MSRELILRISITLDGFVAGPNGEIDWSFPTMSDEGREWTAGQMARAGLIAIGRGSYPGLAAFWSTAPGPIAQVMNETPKVVFSRSGVVSPPDLKTEGVDPAVIERWTHPIVTGTDLVADMQRLKAEGGKPIIAVGGAGFASSLIAAGLVDELLLVTHPVAIGRGVPLFGGIEGPLHMKLEDLKRTDTGVLAKTFRPA